MMAVPDAGIFFNDMYVRLDTIPERDGMTDRSGLTISRSAC